MESDENATLALLTLPEDKRAELVRQLQALETMYEVGS
jgi:hypothetical protein